MSANSEARKRAERAAAKRIAEAERQREVMRDALAEVWSGASYLDADAVLDHLGDRGARIEMQT